MNFYDFLYVFPPSHSSSQLQTHIYVFHAWTYTSHKQEDTFMAAKVKRKAFEYNFASLK